MVASKRPRQRRVNLRPRIPCVCSNRRTEQRHAYLYVCMYRRLSCAWPANPPPQWPPPPRAIVRIHTSLLPSAGPALQRSSSHAHVQRPQQPRGRFRPQHVGAPVQQRCRRQRQWSKEHELSLPKLQLATAAFDGTDDDAEWRTASPGVQVYHMQSVSCSFDRLFAARGFHGLSLIHI